MQGPQDTGSHPAVGGGHGGDVRAFGQAPAQGVPGVIGFPDGGSVRNSSSSAPLAGAGVQTSGSTSQISERERPCSRFTTPQGQTSAARRQSQVTVHGPSLPPHPGQATVRAAHTPGPGLL